LLQQDKPVEQASPLRVSIRFLETLAFLHYFSVMNCNGKRRIGIKNIKKASVSLAFLMI